jgi:heptosyltransferase-2
MSELHVLLCGLNWIGDNIMAMPAVQAYRRAHPDHELSVLVKRGLAPLWRMHAAPARVLAYDDTNAGTFRAGFALRRERFDRCFVMPHSFRSAWIPFLAGIRERTGLPGGFRDALLTRVVPPDRGGHQQLEYFAVLGLDTHAPEPPRLEPPPESVLRARDLLRAQPRPTIGLIPGAARGPSKRWPASRFASVGRQLAEKIGASLVLFGAPGEADLCESVARDAGGKALNLAGQTSLPDWAALLQACDLVICNDSGGMHLAAAVGTRVVAIYGLTDPAATGPLSARARVIQDEGPRARDIPRSSAEAEKRLAAISEDRVRDAACELLQLET